MKKLFKRSLVLIVAAVSISTVARADDVGTVDTGCTNKFAANATTSVNLGNAVKIDKQHSCALVVSFAYSTASTSNIVVQLARSYDGTTFETSPPSTLSFTNAGGGLSTQVVDWTEIPSSVIGSAHSLKIVKVINMDTGSGIATNASVLIVKKLER